MKHQAKGFLSYIMKCKIATKLKMRNKQPYFRDPHSFAIHFCFLVKPFISTAVSFTRIL